MRSLRVAALVVLVSVPAMAAERAVLVYPREKFSFRRVFYTAHQRAIRRELARRFSVEVREQIASADALFETDVRGARLLVISAHGDPFAMFFDGREIRSLDASDIDRLRRFFDQLHPAATIVLQSCEVGRGFAWAVKDAAGPGRRVIAAKGVIPPEGLTITSLDPIDVSILCRGADGAWDCTLRL